MSAAFETTAAELLTDPDAAGIRIVTRYTSPLITVTPPAGTLRADGRDVNGEFKLPDGRCAVTIDSWGSQASRMEAAVETLAEQIGYPLLRFVNDDGTLLTTTARLSHRQADATWRAARNELEEAGVPFQEIMDATIADASALMSWYPISILFGWWHSHSATADKKKVTERRAERLKALGGDQLVADAFEGYARLGPDARSARLITAEIVALGTARRLRMAAKSDSLFGPLKGGERSSSGKSTGPSAVGLGSLPPVMESKAPVDVTYDSIEGTWFCSLAGLRQIGFGHSDATVSRTLLLALGLLLHQEAQRQTRLRAGTELIATSDGSCAEVLRHGAPGQPWEVQNTTELIATVRELGARAGWTGPKDVRIPAGSILDKLLHLAETEAVDS